MFYCCFGVLCLVFVFKRGVLGLFGFADCYVALLLAFRVLRVFGIELECLLLCVGCLLVPPCLLIYGLNLIVLYYYFGVSVRFGDLFDCVRLGAWGVFVWLV